MFSISRTLANVSYAANILFRTTENALPTIAGASSMQQRPASSKHGYKRFKVHDNSWVPRKLKYTDDRLTKDNRDFIQEVISEKFLKPGESPLRDQVTEERPAWTPGSVRCGLIARKIGYYPMWTKKGVRIHTTLLQVVDNHVIRYNPPEIFSQSKYYQTIKEVSEDKSKEYGCLVVGAESADPQLFTSAYNGLFAESGVMPKRKLTRFRITPDAKIEPGTALNVNHFRVGDYVNVRGITRYHGFQGVMKRWGFKGGPAGHGCTKSHRRPGCIGSGRKKGVWKGKKMPGLMGGHWKLHIGLKIWRINTKYNILYVHGRAVPGVINNYVSIYDCYYGKKRHTEQNPPPFPTFYPQDAEEPLAEDMYANDLHTFSDPSITIEEEPVKSK